MSARPGTESRGPAGGPRVAWGVCAALVAAVFLAFLPVLGNGFVDYDDNTFLTENPNLRQGLTPAAVAWALRSTEQANWFPATRLSHLLDVQLFGFNPAGHHLTSLLLHAANTVLLFLVLRGATASPWRSAAVAALFALHPLRAESVAWASERKDVLSVFFWVLTMGAYLRYVRRPGWGRYLLVPATLALGLMAKPLLVTLPLALLLLDFWPLGRFRPTPGAAPLRRLLLEKAPLLALSAAASAATFWAQRAGGAMSTAHVNTWAVRLENAALSYVKYLGKTLLPRDLSPVYFYSMRRFSATEVALAVLALAALTGLGLWAWRRRPGATVGWLWYLGTLVPMIGLVQVGNQALADRYSYVPQIGLFVALAWGAAPRAPASGRVLLAGGAAALALLGLLAALTNLQARHWKDTTALFRQALRVDPRNLIARVNMGLALTKQGDLEAANEQFRTALGVSPRLRQVHYLLGDNLRRQGRREEALRSMEAELAYFPGNPAAHGAAGTILLGLGRPAEAERHFREALRREGLNAESHRGLGLLLLQRGDGGAARYHLSVATRLDPGDRLAAQGLREAQSLAPRPAAPQSPR